LLTSIARPSRSQPRNSLSRRSIATRTSSTAIGFTEIVAQIERIAERFTVLFIRHPSTALQLDKLGLLPRLEQNEHVSLLPRLEYLPFLKAVSAAEFVVSDGGGNQVELSYLGKPALIFREEVEQEEGLGENVVLSLLDPRVIGDFVDRYESFARPQRLPETSPTKVIVDFLEARGFGAS